MLPGFTAKFPLKRRKKMGDDDPEDIDSFFVTEEKV
jgi:hypothetical protein